MGLPSDLFYMKQWNIVTIGQIWDPVETRFFALVLETNKRKWLMKTKVDSVHNNLSRKIKHRIKPANISGCTINPCHGCLKHGFSLFLQPGPTPKFCGFHHTHLSQHLAAAPRPTPAQENHPHEDYTPPCYLVSPEQCSQCLQPWER